MEKEWATNLLFILNNFLLLVLTYILFFLSVLFFPTHPVSLLYFECFLQQVARASGL